MIIFKEVRWSNFLSTGNTPTRVFLNKSPTTLIIGENGAGKSTILDALTYGLFGKPFRRINKPQLMNTINEKGLLVEIEFSIGNKDYLVRRGMKPNLFEIQQNGVMLNQTANIRDDQEYLEKVLLKLNFKSFTQIVVLGSSTFEPFMQLKLSDRRAIVEDLLDIQIFSKMNSVLKTRNSELKSKTMEVDNSRQLVAEKIQLQESYIKKMERDTKSDITEKQKELKELQQEKKVLLKTLQQLNEEVQVLSEEMVDQSKHQKKFLTMSELRSKISLKRSQEEQEVLFYENNSSCTTCRQDIDDEFKTSRISALKTSLEEKDDAIRQMSQEMETIEGILQKVKEVTKKISQRNEKIAGVTSSLFALDSQLLKHQKQIEKLSQSKQIDNAEYSKLDSLKQQKNEQDQEFSNLLDEKQMYEYAFELLKDTGIKTKIIRQYVPVMNQFVNKYLNALDFSVNFTIDENFNETIRSQFRDVFSYSSFSEGEKMRVDLALLFTWRMIAKLKNSVNTNLLILDEVFDSSLDGEGTDSFLKIINTLDKNTNTFVISHKGEVLYDKFRSTIKFVKDKNFSKIETV